MLRVRAVQKVGAMSALLMSAASGAMEDALIKVVALALVHCKKKGKVRTQLTVIILGSKRTARRITWTLTTYKFEML